MTEAQSEKVAWLREIYYLKNEVRRAIAECANAAERAYYSSKSYSKTASTGCGTLEGDVEAVQTARAAYEKARRRYRRAYLERVRACRGLTDRETLVLELYCMARPPYRLRDIAAREHTSTAAVRRILDAALCKVNLPDNWGCDCVNR